MKEISIKNNKKNIILFLFNLKKMYKQLKGTLNYIYKIWTKIIIKNYNYKMNMISIMIQIEIYQLNNNIKKYHKRIRILKIKVKLKIVLDQKC